jgi:choline dehydrogenase-like flavoprotein
MIKGFTPRDFTADVIERFSCPTNFAARYQHRLEASASVRILLHANCTEIVTDRDGARVDHLRVQTLAGGAFTVTATQFILAAGGLEIPRLLLASNATHAAGIGNAYDQVGRNYMCHIAGTFGRLKLNVPKSDVWNGYDIAQDGTYCRRKLGLTPQAQRERGTASAFVRLHFPSIVDPAHGIAPLSALYLAKPFISYEYGKRLAEENPGGPARWLRHAANIALDPFGMAAFTWNWITRRTLAARKFPSVIVKSPRNLFSLDYHAEQQPNPDSRVTLGHETDALGMRRLRIDWRHSPLDIHTAQETARALRQEMAAWGHGTLDYDPERISHDILQYGAYGGHHIGTARMGHSATSSVVDGDGRVHGMRNLYLTGSSVFATSSQANPTLSIVALAARLAEHVRQQADTRISLVAAQ